MNFILFSRVVYGGTVLELVLVIFFLCFSVYFSSSVSFCLPLVPSVVSSPSLCAFLSSWLVGLTGMCVYEAVVCSLDLWVSFHLLAELDFGVCDF